MIVDNGGGSNITSVVDSKGNTWRKEYESPLINSAGMRVLRCYVTNALVSGDTVTVTYPFSFTRAAGKLLQYSGVLNAAKDVFGGTSGNGTALTCSENAIPGYTSELVFAAFASTGAPSFTAGSGYTARGTNPVGSGGGSSYSVDAESKIGSAVTPALETATATLGGANTWFSFVMGLQTDDSVVYVPPNNGLLTQQAVEVLDSGPGVGRITQVAVEVLREDRTVSSAAVTQYAVEVAYQRPAVSSGLTQLAVEVLVPAFPIEDFVPLIDHILH